MAFNPDGKTLASGGWNPPIILWDVSNLQQPGAFGQSLQAHSSYVGSVAFSPDGKTLASGSDSQAIRLGEIGTR